MIGDRPTPAPWKMKKCPCGSCNKYVIVEPYNADGRFELPDARLIVSSHDLLEVVKIHIASKDHDGLWRAVMERAHTVLRYVEHGIAAGDVHHV